MNEATRQSEFIPKVERDLRARFGMRSPEEARPEVALHLRYPRASSASWSIVTRRFCFDPSFGMHWMSAFV